MNKDQLLERYYDLRRTNNLPDALSILCKEISKSAWDAGLEYGHSSTTNWIIQGGEKEKQKFIDSIFND